MLYTLCHPTLSDADNSFIADFRRQHDAPFLSVVPHHFTLVFGLKNLVREQYIEHIREHISGQGPISFSCRYAMLGNDDSNRDFYVFLVPDEGYSDLCRLHDRLYRGYLAPFNRVEIPYIPHIGLATMTEPRAVKRLCDELNQSGLEINGRVDAVTVCEFQGSKIATLEEIPLSPQR